MKLAGPGTRLLPAYSQWATAAGRFVGRNWRRGPGGCAPGGAGEERGLAGRHGPPFAAGTAGERERCQICIKIQWPLSQAEGWGGDGVSRELCRRANLIPSAVRSFGDARGSSWRLRSGGRRLLACFLSRALRSPPLAPNVNENQAQSARFLRTLSAQNRRWPRLHLRGRPVAPPAGGRALRGRGRGRKEGSDSRTVFRRNHNSS